MIKIYFQRRWHVHFFNRLSIYWEPYLTTVTSEYWLGHGRKRIARLGNLTVWRSGASARTEGEEK